MNKRVVIKLTELFKKEEAAEVLGVHPTTIARMQNQGRLPKNKVGQRYIFTGQDLLNSLATPGVMLKKK